MLPLVIRPAVVLSDYSLTEVLAEDHSDGKFKAEHEEIDSDVVLDEAEVNTAIQMGVGKKKEKRKPKSKKTKVWIKFLFAPRVL